MTTIMKLSNFNTVPAIKKHTATLFFFHGSGDSGENVKAWIDILCRKELKFPHIKIVYPTAPAQPYTPNNGVLSNVWFNRKDISNNVSEEEHSIRSICHTVMELINAEHSNGIPYNRIIVGGFSMGGALSLYLAYKCNLSLGGCIAMSSFLNKNSMVYQHLENNKPNVMPPLLQFHGSSDTLVPIQWGEETYNNLKKLGVNATFVPLQRTEHELIETEIQQFIYWVNNIVKEQ
ncbi:lysophospholipase-like protein 1 [Polistes fuscatus]|uniref:lysophospholipase-like protein 1 n=1 Tax=Polistes fuscatus TaxID=30207 RepID=UPI001CA95FCF|nr:lysophospholipase-like protein 1 [Polistes fuscatus]